MVETLEKATEKVDKAKPNTAKVEKKAEAPKPPKAATAKDAKNETNDEAKRSPKVQTIKLVASLADAYTPRLKKDDEGKVIPGTRPHRQLVYDCLYELGAQTAAVTREQFYAKMRGTEEVKKSVQTPERIYAFERNWLIKHGIIEEGRIEKAD